MGYRFRKTKNIGPLRLTLSKKGLGASVGVKGFRIGKTASGRTRATASIPGTGISYVQENGGGAGGGGRPDRKKRKRALLIGAAIFLLLVVIGACSSRNASPEPTPTPTPTAALSKALPEPDAPEKTARPTASPERTFVLNTSSHVYHKPSCSSAKNIKEANREEFTGTREEVEAMGYEACSRCGG